MFNRKKQRRQAAAGVVQGLLGGGSAPPAPASTPNNPATSAAGRKSTAQPRPDIVIPPRGIGPIADPNENDVLCGRGGRINSHVGNRQFRDIIQSHKKEYLAPSTKKLEKAHIAAAIVNDIRSRQPPGRFLKEDGKSGMWYDIGDAKAIKKTGQALREDAPEIRPEIDGESVAPSESPSKLSKQNGNGASAAAAGGGGGATKPKSPIPKTINASSSSPSSRNASLPSSFDAHGPQLLPEGRVTKVDQQGRAAMPPPFHQSFNHHHHHHQQAIIANNPYLNPGGGTAGQFAGSSSSFQPRSIPIQAPQNLSADYLLDVQQQQALFTRPEENAFGRPFHPPESAIGSEGTMSTISGLTDPVRSTMSASGMNGSHGAATNGRSPARAGGRIMNHHNPHFPSRGGSSFAFQQQQQHSQYDFAPPPPHHHYAPTTPKNSNQTARFSDVGSYIQMSVGAGDHMSMNGGSSIARSSSFPDMSSIIMGGGSEAGDSDLAQLRSVLSGSGRNNVGSSLMSITSGTSSSQQWMMNADMDVRSMNMSDMSSGLNALDLA